jgi:NADP-dependent 3-hydroxy acid dehydrogenase YdfG
VSHIWSFFPVKLLICCLSGLVKGVDKAPEISLEDINVMFATNVTGLINMTQTVMEVFKKRPDGGRGDIINIGSIAGREGYPGGSIYCASKAAVRTFTDALRKELIASRIRVIEIDPGQVETVSGSDAKFEQHFETNTLGTGVLNCQIRW